MAENINVGMRVSASLVNTVNTGSVFAAHPPDDQVVTTSLVDVQGCEVRFTTLIPDADIIIEGIFDVDNSGATTGFFGLVAVDVDVGTYDDGAAFARGLGRRTVYQTWFFTIETPGEHFAKLMCETDNSTDVVTVMSNTSIVVFGRGVDI